MLWSSYGPRKYATGVALSASGTLAGPWIQQKEPLWMDDSGDSVRLVREVTGGVRPSP